MKKLLILLTISFLFPYWKSLVLEKKFITWIEILLKDQQSCVINGETTPQYFNLERVARHGDPVLAYLFILVLEFFFFYQRTSWNKKYWNIWTPLPLYCISHNTTLFLKDAQSIENLVEVFNTFSLFSGLKPNLTKCEIAGIGALKGVQVAVCGMKCTDLCNEAIKIVLISHTTAE